MESTIVSMTSTLLPACQLHERRPSSSFIIYSEILSRFPTSKAFAYMLIWFDAYMCDGHTGITASRHLYGDARLGWMVLKSILECLRSEKSFSVEYLRSCCARRASVDQSLCEPFIAWRGKWRETIDRNQDLVLSNYHFTHFVTGLNIPG